MLPSEIVKAKGWMQGELKNDSGRVCLVQAVWEWSVQTPLMDNADFRREQFYDAIYDQIGGKFKAPYLTLWNDDSKRTQHEVIEVLQKAEQELGYASA